MNAVTVSFDFEWASFGIGILVGIVLLIVVSILVARSSK